MKYLKQKFLPLQVHGVTCRMSKTFFKKFPGAIENSLPRLTMAIKIKSEWRDKKKGNVVLRVNAWRHNCEQARTSIATLLHEIFATPCLFRDFDVPIFRDAILRKFYILNLFNFLVFECNNLNFIDNVI